MAQFIKLAQSAILLACTGGWAIAFPTNTSAQTATDIPITGGNVVFGDTQIFVPTDSTTDGRTFVHGEGSVPDSFLIRTSQGDIPLTAIIRGSTLPVLSTAVAGTPAVGDTGEMLGTLTFRGFSASGEPALFTDIPVELQFQVNAITLGASTPYTQYRTVTGVLSETGTVETPSSSADVTRDTSIFYVQFQPEGTPAQDIGVIPASEFNAAVIPGASYNADFSADLTGGSVTVPVPPGFGQAGNTGGDSGETPVIFSPSSVFVTFFLSSETDFTIFTPGEMGDFQGTPVMPGATLIGIFIFTSVPSGVWVDPPMVVSQAQTTFGFDFVMKPRPVPVGVASRVFPGMVGVGAASDATFTAITGLPEGIDADDRYTVSVGDVVVGEFSPGDTVRFSDYREALGDRLVDGEGVTQFQISGIEPGVDSSDPTAFPVRLEYSTPTASFEMRASTPRVAATPDAPAVASSAVEEVSAEDESSVPTITPSHDAQPDVSTQN